MGSCRGAVDAPKPGDGVGDGAEKRSSGRPDDDRPDPLDPAAALSVGSDRPPSPDIGASSSAKASNEMRSAAFLFGLALRVSMISHARLTHDATSASALDQSPALTASYRSSALLIRSLHSNSRSESQFTVKAMLDQTHPSYPPSPHRPARSTFGSLVARPCMLSRPARTRRLQVLSSLLRGRC